MSTHYKQENKEYINKQRTINKLNKGLMVENSTIEKYSICISEIDVEKLHSKIDKTLLENQIKQEIITKHKLNKMLPITPNSIWNKQYILSLEIKNVKENTLNQYISRTNVMLRETGYLCLKSCVNSTKFLEYIKTQKNTKRILALLFILIEHHQFPYDIKILKEINNELLEKEKKELLEHTPIIVCSYEDLLNKRDEIQTNCIEKVIAHLYLDNAKNLHRAELFEVRLHTTNITHRAHYNWINLSNGKLHLNKFKNSHKKESHIVELQPKTMEVIRKYIKPFDLFLINLEYPKFLELFKSIFGCTIQQFRRVVETHNMVTMTTKEFVLNCHSHSPEVAVQYYVGSPKKNETS